MEFSSRALMNDVSFVVNERDRIALVGKNGAGKSTLLKILAGLQAPTSGTVNAKSGTSIGYLPQVMRLADGLTVRQEAEKAYSHLHKLQEQIDQMGNQLRERGDTDCADYLRLLDDFTHQSERLRTLGGLNYSAELERTLQGLGFSRTDLDRPTSELSGGWRMRIELAKLLLVKPDLLLLDEPTNHLDIESIEWLEQYLATRGGALIVVSHDRAFLQNVTNRTMEISLGRIYDYKVKYNEFVTLRAERREQQLRAYENQQREIADTKAFIDRFRYKPSKAVQVQSRIKQLEKIVPIEVDEVDNSSLHLKFSCPVRSGDFPLILEDVEKTYDHKVFDNVNLTLKRGEKVAFVGRNGEGKSTLVKCIMGETEHGGKITIGHNVQIGYFAQNQAQLLDENLTVLDTIDRAARGEMRLKIRDILGAFMFGGEASDKKVKVLSGGERTRLAMIKLLLEPVNFLILDEPTNHLDMRSKDVLKEAIRDFAGTVIVVSHDRDFLDGMVSRIYEFAGGRVREHIGGIYDFLGYYGVRAMGEQQKCAPTPAQQSVTPNEPSAARLTYEEQKARARRLRKLEKTASEAEETVNQMEQALRIVEAQMATAEGSADMKLYERHASLKRQQEAAETEWEQAMEELEKAQHDNI
ncbi:MAG: ATP-binding cassette domain-containing protein [Prevotellaceae bacterium]|nr:ATP-binding cassette domain-containing protein [Prevotellaceae bacterium]